MSDQHLIDFMDETGLSAEDILTVFANDELAEAEVRIAAFTSLMGIWKDEREHVRGISEEARSFLTDKLSNSVVMESLMSVSADASLPTSARMQAAARILETVSRSHVGEGPALEEMTLEQLQAETARLNEIAAASGRVFSETLDDVDGGDDDRFQ